MLYIINRKLTKTEITERLLKKYEVNIEDLNYDAIKTFKEKIKALSDSRQKGKCKYKIWDIVVVSFLAILANCNDWEEIREKVKSLNVLNVYSNNLGMCIASQMIDDKTNEIPTIPKILDKINVKGNIIT